MLGSAGAASAETDIPPFFNQTNWFNKVYPGSHTAQYGPVLGGTDEWLYPDFPIACNNSTTKNHFRLYWVYPDDVASTMNKTWLHQVTAAASSGIEASAGEILYQPGSTTFGTELKYTHSPRWTTEQYANGNCYASVTQIAVPRGYLERTPNTGPWDPYTTAGAGTAGVLNKWMRDHGYEISNQISVYLLQEWGTPTALAGISTNYTSSPNGTTPDPALNLNNRGGRAIYLRTALDPPNDALFEWGRSGHELMHEMAHTLGAPVSTAPNLNPSNSGHPKDCPDILCYAGTTAGQTYVAGRCTYPSGSFNVGALLETLRGSNRLDCNSDDYYTYGSQAWQTTRWNTHDSSFLWANPQP